MIKIKRNWLAILTVGAVMLSTFSLPSNVADNKAAEEKYEIINPIRSNSVTTWDCITFGNYWQNDTNGDGKVDQDDEKEPIKWRVLSIDGNDAFLVSDQNLDCQPYNTEHTSETWETCTLRTWLNDTFFNNAFSSLEQQAIKSTIVVNDDNSYWSVHGGNNTRDKVYLLSFKEAQNVAYGFDAGYGSSETRVATNTAYVAGVNNSMSSDGKADSWWLRSSGGMSNYAMQIDYRGGVDYYGGFVDITCNVIRPALHLNLSSSLWKYAGTATSKNDGMLTTAKPSSFLDARELDTKKIEVNVSDYDDLSGKGIQGARVVIEGIGQADTDEKGEVLLDNTLSVPSEKKKIQVTKEGYRDYIYYTTLISPENVSLFATNRQRISMKKKKTGDDVNPYISSLVYYSDEIAKNCGGQSFAASDNVTFRACGIWNEKAPGYYQLYWEGQDGCSIDSEDGIFRVNIGKDLKGKGNIYVKMIAKDGTESEPEKLYIKVPENITNSDVDGGIPILNEVGESPWQESVPFLNNDKLSFDLGNFKTTVKRDGSKVRIMLGKEKRGDVFKDEEWEEWKKFCESQPTDLSLSQWKNILESDNLSSSWTSSAKAKITGYGWLENDLSADSATPLTGGIQIILDFSTSFKQQYVVGVIPVYMEQTLGVNGKLEGKVTFDTKEKKFGGSNKVTVIPSLNVGGGVGVLYVATVGAEGSASMPVELNIPKGIEKANLEGSLSLKASVLGFDYSKVMAKATYPLYPGTESKEVKGLSQRLFSENDEGMEECSKPSMYDMSCYYLPEEKSSDSQWYGALPSKLRLREYSQTKTGLNETLLQSGTSELTEPQVVQEGGTTLAVFLMEDNSREIIHRTKLVYTIYDKESGQWSEPVAVCEDGTGDFLPGLSSSHGKIAISWLNYAKSSSDSSSMEEALKNSEICSAVWDESTGTFKKETEVMSSSSAVIYNSSYPYVDEEGNVTLAGLKNTGADIFGTSGDNILFIKGICDGKSIDRQFSLSHGLPVSYDITGKDGIMTVAVCLDTDKDLTTLDDREIYLFFSDGTSSRVTKNSTYDSSPQYACYQGEDALYWYAEDGYHLRQADGTEQIISMKSGEAFSENYTVVSGKDKKTAIVWSAADENGIYQLAANIFDASSGEWSRQVLVSDSDEDIFRSSGYYNENGEMELLYCKGSRLDSGKLYHLRLQQTPDLQVVDAYIKDGEASPGKKVKTYVGVKNLGTKKITDYTISVDGQETEGTTEILPGESKLVEADYVMDDFISYSEIPLTVSVADDGDNSNNSFTLKTGYADLSLVTSEDEQENGKVVHVALQNMEAVPADAVLEVRKNTNNGELLYSTDLGTIKQGEIITKDFFYEKIDGSYDVDETALYYVVISSEKEKYISNNYDYSILKDVSKEIDGDKTPTPLPTASPSPIPVASQNPIGTVWPSSIPMVSPNSASTGNLTMEPTSKPIEQLEDDFNNNKEVVGTTLNDASGAVYKVLTENTVAYLKPARKSVVKAVIPPTITANGTTFVVSSVSKNAFAGCDKLKSVSIGKNVTSIGDKAFYNCKLLSKITIPVKVAKIGKQVFAKCKKMKLIIIKSSRLTTKSVGSKAFKGIYKKPTIKVSNKKKKEYKKLLIAKGLTKKAKIKKD